VLLGERGERLVVVLEEGVFSSAESVERDDERVRARAVVRRRHVHVIRDDLPRGVEQVVPLEITGFRRKRILARARGCGHGLGFDEILIRIERAELDPGAVHVTHPIDWEENVRAQVFRCFLRVGFEPCHEIVETLAQVDEQGARAKRPIAVDGLDIQLVSAVGHIANVELKGIG
jgi:hypothetical protein